MKNKSGITLIALIISIIVLLILAGVTIATITGENGLLSKAQLAKEKTTEAESDEKDKLSSYENELSNYGTWERTGGEGTNNIPKATEIDLSTIDSNAKGQIVVNNGAVTITGSVSKSVAGGGVVITLPNELKPSSNKYGQGMFWDSTNGTGIDKYVLNSSGELINPSGVTRTEFYFSITYVLE